MALTTTPSLPVLHSARSASGQMSIILKPPYVGAPFLSILNITQVGGGPPISGNAVFGADSSHGGHANLQANPNKYAYLCGFVPSGAGAFTVEVTYDSVAPHAVTDIICTVVHSAVHMNAVAPPPAE